MKILNEIMQEYEQEKSYALYDLYLAVIRAMANNNLKTKDQLITLFLSN